MTTPLIRRNGRRARRLATTFFVAALAGATALTAAPPLFSGPPSAHAAAPNASSLPASFADMIERVSPAVVHVEVTMSRPSGPALMGNGGEGIPPGIPPEIPEFFKRFFGDEMPFRFGPAPRAPQDKPMEGAGSGFIVDEGGYIVTNDHVVRDSSSVIVTLKDGRKLPAKVVGRDTKTDLALLKVDADAALPTVSFGDSAAVRVGDWVVAVGNPFGLDHSVTAGIVSARGRSIGSGPYDDFLQIDAPINRGNSGGPSFNLAGEVIGVNTAIFSPNGGSVGIGFAIPANLVKEVVADLKEHGTVSRGWLGVSIQEVTPELADSLGLKKAQGALVAEVQPDGPAAGADIRTGDVIVGVDGKAVDSVRALPRLIAGLTAGHDAKLRVWRNGSETTVTVEIAAMPGSDTVAAAADAGTAGMSLAGIDEEKRRGYRIGADVTGVIVTEVEAGSPAARQGIQPGDVIVAVGNQKVKSPAEVAARIAEAKKQDRKSVLLLLNRQSAQRFVALPLGTA